MCILAPCKHEFPSVLVLSNINKWEQQPNMKHFMTTFLVNFCLIQCYSIFHNTTVHLIISCVLIMNQLRHLLILEWFWEAQWSKPCSNARKIRFFPIVRAKLTDLQSSSFYIFQLNFEQLLSYLCTFFLYFEYCVWREFFLYACRQFLLFQVLWTGEIRTSGCTGLEYWYEFGVGGRKISGCSGLEDRDFNIWHLHSPPHFGLGSPKT